MSGESAKDRPALQAMINYARESDAFVFYSIDRLARDLKDIISTLDNKRVSISFLAERLTFSAEEMSISRMSVHRILNTEAV